MWGKIDTTEVVLQIWNKDMSMTSELDAFGMKFSTRLQIGPMGRIKMTILAP